jgi:hypothetical protein
LLASTFNRRIEIIQAMPSTVLPYLVLGTRDWATRSARRVFQPMAHGPEAKRYKQLAEETGRSAEVIRKAIQREGGTWTLSQLSGTDKHRPFASSGWVIIALRMLRFHPNMAYQNHKK